MVQVAKRLANCCTHNTTRSRSLSVHWPSSGDLEQILSLKIYAADIHFHEYCFYGRVSREFGVESRDGAKSVLPWRYYSFLLTQTEIYKERGNREKEGPSTTHTPSQPRQRSTLLVTDDTEQPVSKQGGGGCCSWYTRSVFGEVSWFFQFRFFGRVFGWLLLLTVC